METSKSFYRIICFQKLTFVFRTPHESLKLARKTVRQFFRVVTSEVNQFTAFRKVELDLQSIGISIESHGQSNHLSDVLHVVQVSFWYSDHSTPTPRGVVPDPSVTLTVAGNKFSRAGVRVDREAEARGREQMVTMMRRMQMREQARCDYHQSYPGTCDVCDAVYQRKFGTKNNKKKKHNGKHEHLESE